MSFLTFLFQLWQNMSNFIYDRIVKEYEYLFSTDERDEAGDSVLGEFYVKEIVDRLTKERVHEYDPYIIEDRVYTWLRIPLIVEVEHLETFVEGLKSLHTAENCEIIEEDDRLYVNANLGAGPLYFNIFAWAKLAHIEQLVIIKASLTYCKVNAKFSVDTETGRNGSLQSLCIEEFGDVNVCITGFGCLSWLLSKLITLLMKLNHIMVRNLVEYWIEHYVSQFLPDYQLPNESHINNASNYENYGALDNFIEILQEPLFMARQHNIMPINARNINRAGHQHQTDCEESSKETVSQEDPSEDATVESKLKHDTWYTNIPLLEGNAVIQGHDDSESESDNISLQFKFSKNDVILEDVEPLLRPDMATCCVFFRSETDLKKSETKNTGKYLPFKNSEEFLKGLLTTFETSHIGGESMFSEELDISSASEETNSCIEGLMETFFEDYPNFIALTYNASEEQKLETSSLNDEIDSYTEENVRECENEDLMEDKDAIKLNVALTAGSQEEKFNLNRGIGDTTELSETVDQTQVLQNINDLQCSLSMVSTSDHLRTEKSSKSNETGMQEVKRSLKRMNEKCNAISKTLQFMQQNELLNNALTKDSSKGHGNVEQVQDKKKINLAENIESILKWTSDSENIESDVSKSNIPRDFTLSKELVDKPLKISNVRKGRSKHKNLKDSSYDSVIKKTCENEEIYNKNRNVKKVKSFKNSSALQKKNVNESILKYDTSIERLNVIGAEICKCFENPWMENPVEGTSFFFTDNESNTISDLSKLQKSELAVQLGFIDDIKVEELRKETDHFAINLDAILKEVEAMTHSTPDKISITTESNSSLQSETTISEGFDISKLVKNFFEQNPIEKILSEQMKTTYVGADNECIDELNPLSLKEITFPEINENYLNLSVSPKTECVSIVKGHPSDLLYKWPEESSASLAVEKFDLPSKDSATIDDERTWYAHNPKHDKVRKSYNDLDWSDILPSDETSEGSFEYEDKKNICTSPANDSDFLENAYVVSLDPVMDHLNKIDFFYGQSYEASGSGTASDNSSLKLSDIRIRDIYEGSRNKVNEEQVLIEKLMIEFLGANNKTGIPEEQIVSIKETKMHTNAENDGIKSSKTELAKIGHQYEKYTLMSCLSFEQLYDKLCEDILLLISEDAESDSDLNVEESLSKDLLTDNAKKQKDCTDITEKLQLDIDQVEGKRLESLEESSIEQLHSETLNTFCTIQDEAFVDISEQTNILRSMFEEFVLQHQQNKFNLFTEEDDQKSYTKDLKEQPVSEHEKLKIQSILNMDKDLLIEIQQKSCVPTSGQSTEDNIDLWKESVIVDVNGGVSWNKALQIWGM